MDHELTYFTFLEDPDAYQVQPGDLCVQVPAGISVPKDLLDVLKERLGFQPFNNSLYNLREFLGFWQEDRGEPPQRVVILHHDLPLWQAYRLWWLDVGGYLAALIERIAQQREQQTSGESAYNPELVAIFPREVSEELNAVLTRPPDWHLSLGFARYNDELITEIDPSWSLIQEYVRHLDGLVAEECSLSREGAGVMQVQYLRQTGTYCLKYFSGVVPQFASREEQPVSWPPTVSLAQVEQSLHHFFTREKPSEDLFWIDWASVPAGMNVDLALKLAHFRGPEEALLDHSIPLENPVSAILVQGVGDALWEGLPAFDLAYWQQVLKQADAPLSRRLAAICLVGRSDLPNAAELLRPLFKGPVKQERWVSARFGGLWKEEEALPVLLDMLTDELPFGRPEGDTPDEWYKRERQYEWGWYDQWRWHAPYLLRAWRTQAVGERLRESLAIWVQEEPSLKYEEPNWDAEEEDEEEWEKLRQVRSSFAAQLCFELGYRGDVGVLEDLPIGKRYRFELQQAIREGAKVKERCKTPLEEYQYRAGESKIPAFLGWKEAPS